MRYIAFRAALRVMSGIISTLKFCWWFICAPCLPLWWATSWLGRLWLWYHFKILFHSSLSHPCLRRLCIECIAWIDHSISCRLYQSPNNGVITTHRVQLQQQIHDDILSRRRKPTQKWAFVYLGHTKVDICVCVVMGLGNA